MIGVLPPTRGRVLAAIRATPSPSRTSISCYVSVWHGNNTKIFRHRSSSVRLVASPPPLRSTILPPLTQNACWKRHFRLSSFYRDVSKQEKEGSPSPTATTAIPSATTSTTSTTTRFPSRSVRHENIWTTANILTFSRLLSAPLVGYFILTSQPYLALSLFAYAGLTDAVDGYIARRYNQQTVVGTVIDPMADKALMTTTVLALTYTGILPWWLATIVLGRDILLAISAIYYRWISLPPPKTMTRYWDFSLPSAEVRPTEISKINTLLQLLLIGNAMLLPVLPASLLEMYNLQGLFEGWQYLVAGTTVWSGASYLYSPDAVKILTKQEAEDRKVKSQQVAGGRGGGRQ